VGAEPAATKGELAGVIAESGELLARSLDYRETLATVARLVVPAYADWCFVEMLTAAGGIERAVMEHADPAKRAFVEEYDRDPFRAATRLFASLLDPVAVEAGKPAWVETTRATLHRTRFDLMDGTWTPRRVAMPYYTEPIAELQDELEARGLTVTQSSVSRDLHALRVAKIEGRYVLPIKVEYFTDLVVVIKPR
jgi:hypothetical protein